MSILPVFLVLAQAAGQAPTGGEAGIAHKAKQWIAPAAPTVAIAPYRGTRYEALVPDTLDVAEMARLAVGGLTGPLDPADDYSLYWVVGYHNYPPVMRKEECPHIQTKFMEALPLMRLMTGSSVNEHVDRAWMNNLVRSLGPDGLAYRTRKPGETWTALPILGQGRLISVMTLAYLRDKDPAGKERIEKIIRRLGELVVDRGDYAHFNMENFPLGYRLQPELPMLKAVRANECTARLIQPLGHYFSVTGYQPAKVLGDKLVNGILRHSEYWGPNGEWLKDQLDPAQNPGRENDVHTGLHSHVLVYLSDYAARTKNAELLAFCRKSYAWAKRNNSTLPGQCETATRIGFWVEYQNPYYPTAETCGVADMIAVAVILSRAGADDCWDDADRWTRNHFAECQMRSTDWVTRFQHGSWPRKPEADETTDRVPQRNLGTFFGWPTANDGCPQGGGHMHCCMGNASRTLYYLWESILEHNAGRLRVHLVLNRASRWADVDSYLPYSGQVDVKVKQPLAEVLLRVPEWVPSGSPQVRAARGKTPIELTWRGRYVSLGPARPGETLSLTLPIAERTITRRVYGAPVETVMGGVVYQSITFRGNEVVDIDPPGKNYPFYQRAHYRGEPRWRKLTRFVSDESIQW
jgi:hypothetical protein